MLRADASGARGWRSRYYWQKEPALSLVCEARGQCTVFVSYLGPLDASYDSKSSTFEANTWRAIFAFDDQASRIKDVRLDGAFQEHLIA